MRKYFGNYTGKAWSCHRRDGEKKTLWVVILEVGVEKGDARKSAQDPGLEVNCYDIEPVTAHIGTREQRKEVG